MEGSIRGEDGTLEIARWNMLGDLFQSAYSLEGLHYAGDRGDRKIR